MASQANDIYKINDVKLILTENTDLEEAYMKLTAEIPKLDIHEL